MVILRLTLFDISYTPPLITPVPDKATYLTRSENY